MKKTLDKKKVAKKPGKKDGKIWLGFYSTCEKLTPPPINKRGEGGTTNPQLR